MKKSINKKVWVILGIIFAIAIIAIAYNEFFVPKPEPKPMPDYTWQQVAYMGVVLLGIGWILRAFQVHVHLNGNTEKIEKVIREVKK